MNKQIEDMTKHICIGAREGCDVCGKIGDCSLRRTSERLYNAGYRKSTDVAREIFAKIEHTLDTLIWAQDLEIKTNRAIGFNSDAERFAVRKKAIEDAKDCLQIVKKKYESEGADDETTNH